MALKYKQKIENRDCQLVFHLNVLLPGSLLLYLCKAAQRWNHFSDVGY